MKTIAELFRYNGMEGWQNNFAEISDVGDP